MDPVATIPVIVGRGVERRGAVDAAAIGGKAVGLLRLHDAGVEVPPWFVIGAAAFDRLVPADGGSHAASEAAEAVGARVRSLALSDDFRDEVLAALAEAGLREVPLAVRSSAVGEDAAGASYAGQFESVLGVVPGADGEALWDAIRRVRASAFGERVAAYRARAAADEAPRTDTDGGADAASGAPPRMAVIVQAMADASAAGVAFSADPVSGDRTVAVIGAVFGLGEALVAGELDGDTYRVRPPGARVYATLAEKTERLTLAADGAVRREPVPPALRRAPVLTDDEARRIAAAARRLEDALGAPQDVEWALADPPAGTPAGQRRLLVLQTRPITTLDPAAEPTAAGPADHARTDADGAASAARGGRAAADEPAGDRRIWDNSNIIESYSGVTTSLTFSFARSVYEHVYRQFCRLLGVDEARIDRHRHVFTNMLGLIRGRVYYNLLNWYRMLALLPGFALNRGFMERMMGVAETLEDPPGMPNRGRDALRVARSLRRMVREHRRLRRAVPAFRAHVDAVLDPLRDEDFTAWSADALVRLYRRLEEDLLRRWETPIVNDFFAMIWFGVLGRLAERWLPDTGPTLVNDLLCGDGDIISTEPVRRIMALAERVADSARLSALFDSETDDAELLRRIGEDPAFASLHAEIRAYLDRFGDRCMNELKLETVTLDEDPAFLVSLVRRYAAQGVVDAEAARERELEVRRAAESLVRRRLGVVRRPLFDAVLNRTRERIRDRENLRFERTRVFGVVRRIMLGLGHALARAGRIDAPRDVFHLTVDELFADVDGRAVTADLHAVVELRRTEFDGYRRAPAPPDRFETHGPPGAWGPDRAGTSAAHTGPAAAHTGPAARTTGSAARSARPGRADPGGAARPGADELYGTGCCPGVVRAPVALVRDPRRAPDLAGRILVAERTDPGWTLLFPAASGLLVERGSLLSHSAIVAREMGLPCIVAVPDLMRSLEDGEVVEMDGAAGVVRRAVGVGPDDGARGRAATTAEAAAADDAPGGKSGR